MTIRKEDERGRRIRTGSEATCVEQPVVTHTHR